MSWGDRVSELLYEGETVREEVDVGGAQVFVTSHRLLAFTPGDGGANYRAVERPNVDGVTAGDESDGGALAKAVSWAILGVGCLLAGLLLEVGSLLPTPTAFESGAAASGAGGFVSLFETIFTALSLVDEAVAVSGVVVLAVAAYYGWRYAESRERVVTVDVAGDEDLDLVVDAADGVAESIVDDLRRALELR